MLPVGPLTAPETHSQLYNSIAPPPHHIKHTSNSPRRLQRRLADLSIRNLLRRNIQTNSRRRRIRNIGALEVDTPVFGHLAVGVFALAFWTVGHGVAATLEGVRDVFAFGNFFDCAGKDVDEPVANP
jgi:lysyl-tRNA synthetase class II